MLADGGEDEREVILLISVDPNCLIVFISSFWRQGTMYRTWKQRLRNTMLSTEQPKRQKTSGGRFVIFTSRFF